MGRRPARRITTDVGQLAYTLSADAAPEPHAVGDQLAASVARRSDKPDDAWTLDMLLEWVPDEATRNKTLVDNPARLYGF